jgi:hypothetical protein
MKTIYKMKTKLNPCNTFLAWSGLLLLLALALAGCNPATEPTGTGENTDTGENGETTVFSSADLVAALEGVGATIALSTEIEPAADIFTVPGQLVHIGDEEIQVYLYESTEAATADANRVSASGDEISAVEAGGAANMVAWEGTPHFYQFGNIVVVYVGENSQTMSLLESALGSPFAGG